jgi:hypothetical protein
MKLDVGVRVKLNPDFTGPGTKMLFGRIKEVHSYTSGGANLYYIVKWDDPEAVEAGTWSPYEPFGSSLLLVADNGLLRAIRKAKEL